MEDSISTASAEEKEKPKLKATGHVFQVHWLCLIHMKWNCVIIMIALHKYPFEMSRIVIRDYVFCRQYILFAVHLLKPMLCPPLQALQYLRKLCNHPSLVLTPQHPEYKRITEELASQNSNLRDIQHAPKLSALKQVKALGLVYCRTTKMMTKVQHLQKTSGYLS